jgi:hypothetical protein
MHAQKKAPPGGIPFQVFRFQYFMCHKIKLGKFKNKIEEIILKKNNVVTE